MADKKISQLTAITAPIAGTDVLPIVQSSTTKKITVAQLVPGLGSFTAPSGNVKGLVWTDGTVLANDATVTDVGYDTSTNTVQTKNLTVASTATITNGNLVIGTSGKGIDFSATAQPAAGMTSELLADYEEGTWTATLTGTTGAPSTPVTATGTYTKIGRQVTLCCAFVNKDTTGASGYVLIQGMPYTSSVTALGAADFYNLGSTPAVVQTGASSTEMTLQGIATQTAIAMSAGAGRYLYFTVTYFV